MLPVNGNMTCFAAQRRDRAFKVFAGEAEVGSVAQLTAPLFWMQNDRGGYHGLGSCANVYGLLEQPTFLDVGIKPMHDWRALDSTAPRRSPLENEVFVFRQIWCYFLVQTHIFCSSIQGQQECSNRAWEVPCWRKDPCIGICISPRPFGREIPCYKSQPFFFGNDGAQWDR